MKNLTEAIGLGFVILSILGFLGVIDFHVYVGPEGSAKEWHARHAK